MRKRKNNMEKINFTFKIQPIAEILYEEDYNDLNDTEQNLVRITFNHIRKTVINMVLNSMDMKITPDTLTVTVPEKDVLKILYLVIDLIDEIQGKVYIEDIYNIVRLDEIQNRKLEAEAQMMMVTFGVIQ